MLRHNPLFSDEYIQARWHELVRAFFIFKPKYEELNEATIELEINPDILAQVVASYFHDVARYKIWHFSENPSENRIDDTKKSAYMFYWLNKLRPISTSRVGSGTDRESLLGSWKEVKDRDTSLIVNTQFALSIAMGYLRLGVADKMVQDLLYVSTYRTIDPNVLMVFFETLSRVKVEKENPKFPSDIIL